ncbi:hypothetical protein [uncultured Psychrobacter sp.]|jgi:hypothetical protein|uniref:hypothetical protein n=2 Tax=uncultured Psychrobacter sp. TaxID=259303 RepID=UPI00262AB512|nr:hypothetical protein [uncultured Psychrobacter sp.]
MSKLPMQKNSLQPLMVSMLMIAGVSLSACNDSNPSAESEASVSSTTEEVATEAPTDSTDAADLDGAVASQGTPISYDTSSWGSTAVEPVTIDELDNIQSTFGSVVTTDKNSLDYASNPATKYRFMQADEPYLDIIDSQKYLELGWYYANPTDTDKEKELSQAHAQKAYTLVRQLMGDEGGRVLADMLNGQIVKNKTAGGQTIELAKCEFYSCMIIFNKSKAQASAG